MLSVRIKGLRKEAGLSQEQLANKLGVSRQAVTKWETGLGLPDLDNLVRLSELFGVTTDSLLKADESSAPGNATDGFSSETLLDVLEPRDVDIAFGSARNVTVAGGVDGKVHVVLSSDAIEAVGDAFKVELDTEGRSLDISVKPTGAATTADARAALDILLEIPANWEKHVEVNGSADSLSVGKLSAEHVEVGGKISEISFDGFAGQAEVDGNIDLQICCATLPAKLDINQINAMSHLTVPAGSEFVTKRRGIVKNKIVLDGVEETSGAACVIEYNGMKSELTISTK